MPVPPPSVPVLLPRLMSLVLMPRLIVLLLVAGLSSLAVLPVGTPMPTSAPPPPAPAATLVLALAIRRRAVRRDLRFAAIGALVRGSAVHGRIFKLLWIGSARLWFVVERNEIVVVHLTCYLECPIQAQFWLAWGSSKS